MHNKDIRDILALISRANIQAAEAKRVVELQEMLTSKLMEEAADSDGGKA